SRTESFCLAALEAGACGVPVVAPHVGGLPETVVDGVTGDLYAPGDEAAAADLLVRMLSDDGRREELARAAVQRARTFGREAVLPSYLGLYDDVLNGGRRARDALAG